MCMYLCMFDRRYGVVFLHKSMFCLFIYDLRCGWMGGIIYICMFVWSYGWVTEFFRMFSMHIYVSCPLSLILSIWRHRSLLSSRQLLKFFYCELWMLYWDNNQLLRVLITAKMNTWSMCVDLGGCSKTAYASRVSMHVCRHLFVYRFISSLVAVPCHASSSTRYYLSLKKCKETYKYKHRVYYTI